MAFVEHFSAVCAGVHCRGLNDISCTHLMLSERNTDAMKIMIRLSLYKLHTLIYFVNLAPTLTFRMKNCEYKIFTVKLPQQDIE